MPLSEPAARELLHSRDIEIRGYRREDGLYDIEAQLADSKSYGFSNRDRGFVEPGEKLHHMWLRLTVDESMQIVASEAATDSAPYTVCPQAAPNFARLAGLRIKAGFLREAAHLVGGTAGCTHLRELFQQIATTAFQTINPHKAWREAKARGEADIRGTDKLDKRIAQKMLGGVGSMVDSCLAYAADGPIVRRRWPQLFRSEISVANTETDAD
jgi:Protein of unknown function (DUF2889)